MRRGDAEAHGTISRPQKPPPNPPLDILRRNVLNVDILDGKWTAGDRVEMDKLASIAVDHIGRLKRGVDQDGAGPNRSKPLDKLPWSAELFGRAYVTKAETEATDTWSPLFPNRWILRATVKPVSPTLRNRAGTATLPGKMPDRPTSEVSSWICVLLLASS
jgi:hypothetical protein